VVELTAADKAAQVKKALKEATQNHYLFLPGADDRGVPHHIYKGSVSSSSTPNTRAWFAENGGVFRNNDGARFLSVYEFCSRDGFPKVETRFMQLFDFQLRYEYALHFLSKMGNKASRIGLDFL
jgi:hypothetical protein